MEELEKFLNCSLIDTLCEARHEEFETLYIPYLNIILFGFKLIQFCIAS